MRTTIDISDPLLKKARRVALESGKSLKAIVEDALRESFARRGGKKIKQAKVNLTTFKGSGLQAGVDLDDTAALMDLMEIPDDSLRR